MTSPSSDPFIAVPVGGGDAAGNQSRTVDAARRMLYDLNAMGLTSADLDRGPVEAVLIAAHDQRRAPNRDVPALVQVLTGCAPDMAATAISRAVRQGLVLDDGVVTLTEAGDTVYQDLRRGVRWYRRQRRSYPNARNDCACCHARDADLHVHAASQPHHDGDAIDLLICHECLLPQISQLAIRERRTLTVRATPDAHPYEPMNDNPWG